MAKEFIILARIERQTCPDLEIIEQSQKESLKVFIFYFFLLLVFLIILYLSILQRVNIAENYLILSIMYTK